MQNKEGFAPTKLTLATLLMASTLMLLGGAAVAPALPQIQEAFPDIDVVFIDLIVTLPSLAIALTGVPLGMLSDRVGKVKVLVPSLLVFAIAGISGYVLNDIYLILAGRFFVGVGIAGISSCCTALITEYYHGQNMVKVLGYQTAAMGLGVLLLEVGGGSLAEYGWHEPFLIYAIGVMIFFMALASLKEPMHDGNGPADNGVFNKGAIIACYIGVFIVMLVMFSIPTKLASFVVETVGASSTMIGIILGLNGVLNSMMCLMYRRIVRHIPRNCLLTIGFLLLASGMLLFELADSVESILLCTCLAGMGIGLSTTTIVNVLSSNVSPSRSGAIMGGYSTAFNFGQFISTFVIAALISLSGSIRSMYVCMGVISLIAAVVFLFVMRKTDTVRVG